MFHVPAFNSDSLFKSQTRTRARQPSFPDERHKHAQTHTWIRGAPSELRQAEGLQLIPTDPSHMDQCLIFNCSETPINHPCVCVCVVVVAAASCLHIGGMDPFTSCNMSLFIYTPEPVV